MSINIDFFNSCKENLKEYYQELKHVCEYIFKKTNNNIFDWMYIECNFVGKMKIQKINLITRNKNYVTDVISECFWENEIKTPMVGKLHICVQKIFSQAKKYNHSFKRELFFLFIHGILHLLGYDHINPEDEKIMFSLQNEILNYFNIKR